MLSKNQVQQTQEQLLIDLFIKHDPLDVLDVLQDAFVSHGTRIDLEALDLLINPDSCAKAQIELNRQIMQDFISFFTLLIKKS